MKIRFNKFRDFQACFYYCYKVVETQSCTKPLKMKIAYEIKLQFNNRHEQSVPLYQKLDHARDFYCVCTF